MKYDEKAAQLQAMTRESESAKEEDFTEAQIHRAIVSSREDIILLVSYLSSVNEQLTYIRWLLIVLIGLLGLIIIFK